MAVSNNLSYPTFARTKPTDAQISKSVVSVLKRFGWKKVTFVHTDENEFQHTADTIYKVHASYSQDLKYTPQNNLRTKLLFLFAGCPANLIPKLL